MKFLEVLENVLLQDDRFVGENNVILKPKVYEACMNMDSALLKLLLADEMLKGYYVNKKYNPNSNNPSLCSLR